LSLQEDYEQVRLTAYRKGNWFAYLAEVNLELDAALRAMRHLGPDDPCAKFLTRSEEGQLILALALTPEESAARKEVVDMLFLNYALFAVAVVTQFDLEDIRDKSLTPDDLIQEANLGILRAIEKYDTTKKCSLATYVKYWVRGMVLMLFRGYKPVQGLFGLERCEAPPFGKNEEVFVKFEALVTKYLDDKVLVDLLMLRHYHGMTPSEIARARGMKQGAVSWLISKGQAKIAAQLREQGPLALTIDTFIKP